MKNTRRKEQYAADKAAASGDLSDEYKDPEFWPERKGTNSLIMSQSLFKYEK
jgi:hypothetical protein